MNSIHPESKKDQETERIRKLADAAFQRATLKIQERAQRAGVTLVTNETFSKLRED